MASPVGRYEFLAPEAKPLVAEFRAGGAVGFHQLEVSLARSSYVSSCIVNGLGREDVASVEDLTTPGGQRVRIYRPLRSEAGEQLPGLLFAHGGGWVIGNLDTHDGICRRISNQTGAAVVAVDYRLAPEYKYPAALEDVRAVERWMRAGARSKAIDGRLIAFMGDSAGGHLIAVLTRERSIAGTPPMAQVLLYPVTDCAMDSPSYRRIAEGFPLTAATMKWFFSLYLPGGVDKSDADLSPLRASPVQGMPDTFICTVGNDPLADEGIAFAAKLSREGASVEHLHLAGYHHGLFTSAGRMPTGLQILDRAAAFVKARLVADRSLGW